MTYGFPRDSQELIRERMASGRHVTEDELFREALREEADDLEAVRQAIDDWGAGDEGVPIDGAFDALRKKHRIS